MMHDIDLIPADYREALQRQVTLRHAVVLVALLLVAAIVGNLSLRGATKKVRADIEELRTEFALSAQQREQLQDLEDRLQALDEEWTLLRGLRSGAAAEDLFVIIDRALPGDDLWFTDWEFQRAGVIAPSSPRTVNTGYFIVVPAGENETPSKDWQVKTHMKIRGQSRDHAALSRFVRGHFEQPEIQDVKVNHTRVQQYATSTVVDFDMAVVLHVEPAA